MTVSIGLLIVSVATLFCYILIGFVLNKTRLAGKDFASSISVFVVYGAQIAMFIHGYIAPFDANVFRGMIAVFILSFVIHGGAYLIGAKLFSRSPEKIKSALIFGSVFSNAGYMGMPLISDVLGEEYLIYATIYLVWFNVFAFSLGRYIYSGDGSYIKPLRTVLNPAVVPITIGLIIYVTGLGGWLSEMSARDASGVLLHNDFLGNAVSILVGVIDSLRRIVAPATMVIIGCRLAEVKPKGLFADKHLYAFLAVRHFMFPILAFLVMKPFEMLGILDTTVMSVVLVLASTPAASATSIFSELYGKGRTDSAYAGSIVAVSTLLSIVTMPLVALLLKI